MFATAHLQTALYLVQSYKGEVPFVHFVKQYFSTHKKHGSRDRKQILQLCYSYFRMGKALPDWPAEKRMLTGLFLGASIPGGLLQTLSPDWNEAASATLTEKCNLAGIDPESLTIFPWTNLLSEGIDAKEFSVSHLYQPSLFLRIRPGHTETVLKKLDNSGVDYSMNSENVLTLPNGFKTEEHLILNKGIVIQDLSSQKTAAFLQSIPATVTRKKDMRIWDCCAASGGKSIMALDIFPHASLTVSDIRSSILNNLSIRFREAGIQRYHRLVADLSTSEVSIAHQDLIIADVPCTGSGTWSRNPDQLAFFDPEQIGSFSRLQRNIVANAVKRLAPAGYFLYITCSVFRQENEDQVEYMQQEMPMELISKSAISGIKEHADSMFAALFRKK
jgi:16S rRNA (cytosine967-C5)-methyltransferase